MLRAPGRESFASRSFSVNRNVSLQGHGEKVRPTAESRARAGLARAGLARNWSKLQCILQDKVIILVGARISLPPSAKSEASYR